MGAKYGVGVRVFMFRYVASTSCGKVLNNVAPETAGYGKLWENNSSKPKP